MSIGGNSMKKWISLLLCMLLFGMFVACGDNGTEGGDDGSSVKIIVADKVTDSIGINSWIGKRQEAFDEQFPEINVEHVSKTATDDFNQIKDIKNILATNSADTPTILNINSSDFARQLYVEGYTGDFAPYLDNFANYNEINEKIRSGYTVGDAVVGLPQTIETPMLGFNTDVLTAKADALTSAGYMTGKDISTLKVETWDDYRQIAKILTNAPSVYGAGFTAQDYYQGFGVWAIANGFDGVVQNTDGTISIDFADNESMKGVLEFFNGLIADGSTSMDVFNIQKETYYNWIWTGKIASFTFYPSWATWFNSSGMPKEKILVRNFPKGPDNTSFEDSYSAVFAMGFVLNKQATAAQVEAVVKYLNFMYGKEAWESRIQFAYDEMILQVVYPPFDTIDTSNVEIDFPTGNGWAEAINHSLSTAYVSLINSVGFTTEIRGSLTRLVEFSSESDLTSKLETLENSATLNWLNNFNNLVKG